MKMKGENLSYTLSRKALATIISYYIIIIFGGIVIQVLIISNIAGFVKDNILFYSAISSLSVSGVLCSFQYLKRIYKACLDDRIVFPTSVDKTYQQVGNVLYFITRPLFAFGFVILAEFAMLGGIIIITAVDFEVNERFLYLCVVVSAFIGFSIGRILDGFESLSTKKVEDTFK